ncbi:MAG: hypothetical protein IJ147_03345 [Lachnospiraceae bacterium]|nr:hypothetical protein [Lachnospiraceae bacterium]
MDFIDPPGGCRVAGRLWTLWICRAAAELPDDYGLYGSAGRLQSCRTIMDFMDPPGGCRVAGSMEGRQDRVLEGMNAKTIFRHFYNTFLT